MYSATATAAKLPAAPAHAADTSHQFVISETLASVALVLAEDCGDVLGGDAVEVQVHLGQGLRLRTGR